MGNRGNSWWTLKVSVSYFSDLVSIDKGGELDKARGQTKTHCSDAQSSVQLCKKVLKRKFIPTHSSILLVDIKNDAQIYQRHT